MMFESLKEKIEYEFNRFTNGKLCESRRSIFTASSEIEVKKMIRARLVQGYAMDTEVKLLEIPDLLDAVYQELTIHGQEPYTNASVDDVVRALAGG